MDASTLEFLKAAAGAAFGAFSAYVAIRSDLAEHKARLKNLEEHAKETRDRIDSILLRE